MSGQYTTRKSLMKQVKMAKGNLETALQHLNRVRTTLLLDHPEIAEDVQKLMIPIVYLQVGIDKVYNAL